MKICVVKLSALGDIIHSMVVLQFIKKKYPDVVIDWVVEDSFKGILEDNPHINKIITVNLKSIKKNKLAFFSQIKLIRKYKKNNYDFVIDAQGLLKSAIVAKLITRKEIFGFSKNSIREGIASFFYTKTSDIAYDKNVIDRNVKLFNDSMNMQITHKDVMNKQAFLYSKVNEIKKIDIIFVLGASKENKIYPKEKFVEVANLLVDYDIEVIWANKYENEAAKYLFEHCDNVNICEKMSLDQLKNKIIQASLVIGGDTGPTHMAWALNIASITIFGNTPDYRNTYITDINKVIKSDTEVNALRLDKNDFSIKNIDPKKISQLAYEILNR